MNTSTVLGIQRLREYPSVSILVPVDPGHACRTSIADGSNVASTTWPGDCSTMSTPRPPSR